MNVQEYLKRIDYRGAARPDLQTLAALQRAHMQTVPFENLSIHTKEPITLTEEWLYNKIVERNRGGFCYELNGLFAWLLRQIGFDVSMLSAGVAKNEGGFGPEFDHMTLLVYLEEDYLVDVGFGDSFQTPLQIHMRGEQRQGGMAYQIEAEGEAFVLYEQSNPDEHPSMQAQYRFTLRPCSIQEYAEMCQYHQTSPQSSFTKKRVCSMATSNGRRTLSDLRFITTENGTKSETMLNSEEEFQEALENHFNIRLKDVRKSDVNAS